METQKKPTKAGKPWETSVTINKPSLLGCKTYYDVILLLLSGGFFIILFLFLYYYVITHRSALLYTTTVITCMSAAVHLMERYDMVGVYLQPSVAEKTRLLCDTYVGLALYTCRFVELTCV